MPDALALANPTHPGRVLKRELDACSLDLAGAARETCIDETTLANILSENGAITESIARKLEQAWEGQRAETWTSLQRRFDKHPKNTHGGKRQGAGRKPTGLVTKALRITTTPEQLEAIELWLASQGRGKGAQAAGTVLANAARQHV